MIVILRATGGVDSALTPVPCVGAVADISDMSLMLNSILLTN
jgi:hypothetical protein